MRFGILEYKSIKFKRAGTEIPCEPKMKDGIYTWAWDELYMTGVDLDIELGCSSFVGSVTLPLDGGSAIYEASVLVCGECVGKYVAETGKTAYGPISVSVGAMARRITVRIVPALSDLILNKPKIAVLEYDGDPLMYPAVKCIEFGRGTVRVAAIATAMGTSDERFAAQYLAECLGERYGEALTEGGAIITVNQKSEGYADERFTVEVSEGGITVTAADRITLLYAVSKLLELYSDGGFRIAKIDDKPTKSLRGFHMPLPAREYFEFTKRLIRYILVPLGYNTVFVEFAGGMRFDRHPEIAEAWIRANEGAREGVLPPMSHGEMVSGGGVLEKREVAELFDYAKSYGIEMIPEVQSLGHVQYITYAHPEIAELDDGEYTVNDTRNEDERPDEFYPHNYCPSNEESYKIIFDIIDEIIEVSRPERYVHIGHDEVYNLGKCKRCRNVPHDVLYSRHLIRLYEYLKAKGLGTVIWSDMLQPVTTYKTSGAINLIPKDVLCLDFIWYFHFDKDIEANLLDKGFTVGIGNLYSSHFPRYESRILKKGVIGGEVSTWCPTNEYMLGKKGKFYDLTYTAEMLRNPESHCDAMREVLSHIITKFVQPHQRDDIRGVSRHFLQRLEIPLSRGSVEGIPDGILKFRKNARIADGLCAVANECFARLYIEHTTLFPAPRIPWKPLYLSGTYTVKYTDGRTVEIPVEYAGGVQHYKRKYAAPYLEEYYRHNGYVGTWFSDPTLEEHYAGEDILLTSLVFDNPHPELTIESISYRSSEGDYTRVVITEIFGVKE